MSWVGIAVVVGCAIVASAVYLSLYLRWERGQTKGMAYYGRSPSEREALKRRMALVSLPAKPLVRLLALLKPRRASMPTFTFEGVCGPPGVCSPELFERAKLYRPRPEDVFVVTQMRCGTTWMQQLVHQIVTRGRGEFDAAGASNLYAMSPWIDSRDSVSIDAAPVVGEKPTRIIKSHLPTSLCPFGKQAKYIYVARHPVSCFASIVDFVGTLGGPLTPPVATLADWYCSDRMYWLPWPRHVDGWWRWAEARENVLFVHFEAMTRDFAAVRDQVADFLGHELSPDEKRRVDEKCSFRYMKEHEMSFEMSPPTMYSVAGGTFLAKGGESRRADVSPEIRERIVQYCRQAMRGAAYPAAHFYPDLGTCANS